ncbi:large ribosomal subunit protein eL39-like [Peromyscus eremicus]|uniref:large ribosomal subunit protein eL39-like n=1 Tax=Peromyscus eremicus TaxID=42410 RepID=UPI0027DDFAB7|nr:large ribosomal subunit protein eL39-like [Peromyscus eremicus]
MSPQKNFRIKHFLSKKQKQKPPIQWTRMETSNKVRCNSERRHWRRTKLSLIFDGFRLANGSHEYLQSAPILQLRRLALRV